MGGRGEVPVACRPDGQQRVADDLRDVAAVGDDDVDDLAEVRVDRAGESFGPGRPSSEGCSGQPGEAGDIDDEECRRKALGMRDRKSTRLNSSHTVISYAVFCLKKNSRTTSA